MQLTTAQIKYILVIYELQPIVRLGQIARRLQVSKPSVHRMLGRLKNRQLIELDEKGLPRMTEIGAEMAQRYAKQYRTMLDFFHRDHADEKQCGRGKRGGFVGEPERIHPRIMSMYAAI